MSKKQWIGLLVLVLMLTAVEVTAYLMRRWRDAHRSTTAGLHSSRARASLRNIPSPLQGTSATMMSK